RRCTAQHPEARNLRGMTRCTVQRLGANVPEFPDCCPTTDGARTTVQFDHRRRPRCTVQRLHRPQGQPSQAE
ncbi:hypothetical protein ACYOEI_29870, partial [Singulisphaera rosea]